ncbi:MAG: saccharopine dehydrogenase NADP-binding domain-containing protein [Sedimenticola sp.]|nr:saccharopine dehydrogenase NADP-binding domain-containing protein [Sedimenticola sp.]MCW8946874.1 saccharopine dehydrogenase NADP-binding domain-containing protein [Sedimenticola sp.]MCW8950805.1 saccharopine dehydrogenase NADP-binding domain-containing protein [Sedimenticola sp.]MCW8974678.1 saccharopine dehydrogenase NADP-binding domain-containing protein [Sedimenticola sp.]
MHRIAIIGAGRIGASIAKLLHESGDYLIQIADRSEHVLKTANLPNQVITSELTITDADALHQYIKGCAAVISACGYDVNPIIAEAAATAGVSYFDLTEDIATTQRIKQIAEKAKAGQVFVPQCGLAPGFIGILGYHMAQEFEQLDHLKLRVGALPEFPTNNLMYNLTWSTEGLINEYCNPCHAIRAGRYVELTPLEGLETFSLDGVSYEAFNTSGGLGTLYETLKGNVSDLTYKTIRYKGHQYLMNFLINDLKLGEQRELLKQIFEKALAVTRQDVVLILVTATGLIDGKFVQKTDSRKIYHRDIGGEHWGAIQITTASSLCTLLDLYFEHKLPDRGYVKQEQICFDDFMANRFAQYYKTDRSHRD